MTKIGARIAPSGARAAALLAAIFALVIALVASTAHVHDHDEAVVECAICLSAPSTSWLSGSTAVVETLPEAVFDNRLIIPASGGMAAAAPSGFQSRAPPVTD